MSKINHGGPAFPSHAGDPEMTDPRNRISCGGMTLRDWFAGQAVSSMLSKYWVTGGVFPSGHAAEVALDAYVIADAMLKAREATP